MKIRIDITKWYHYYIDFVITEGKDSVYNSIRCSEFDDFRQISTENNPFKNYKNFTYKDLRTLFGKR